uniref:Uncharacterized protein n=1 Tax=Romanomermis culicivorax TaxID=13658 RepID=A0A915JGP8_ROMCU
MYQLVKSLEKATILDYDNDENDQYKCYTLHSSDEEEIYEPVQIDGGATNTRQLLQVPSTRYESVIDLIEAIQQSIRLLSEQEKVPYNEFIEFLYRRLARVVVLKFGQQNNMDKILSTMRLKNILNS